MSSPPRVRNRPREEWQCQYRGGFCESRRSLKTNGSLHTLCEVHRRRANDNQRRSQIRKQNIKKRNRSPSSVLPRRRSTPLAAHTVDPEWQDVLSVLAAMDEPDHTTNQRHVCESNVIAQHQIFTPIRSQLGDATPPPTMGNTDDEVLWLLDLESLLASPE